MRGKLQCDRLEHSARTAKWPVNHHEIRKASWWGCRTGHGESRRTSLDNIRLFALRARRVFDQPVNEGAPREGRRRGAAELGMNVSIEESALRGDVAGGSRAANWMRR
jgi:hypothetical protein